MSVPHHSTHANALATLLARNTPHSQAATILGITPSAVTQLAATPAVAKQVAEQQSTAGSHLDSEYDAIEETLLAQLKRTAPLLMRPDQIVRALQIINGAKRRGATTQSSGPATIVQLQLPVTIQNKFVVNSSNQVVSAGEQDLVTISSGGVQKLLEAKNADTPRTTIIEEEDEFGFTHTRTIEEGQGTRKLPAAPSSYKE